MSKPSATLSIPYLDGVIQLSDYDEVVEVLRSPKFVQSAYDVSAPHFLERVLVMLDGQEHVDRRRVEAHLFSKTALEEYKRDHLAPMVDLTIADVCRDAQPGDVVRTDLVPLTVQMLIRVAATVTGLDGVEIGESSQRLINYVTAFNKALTSEWATGSQQEALDAGLAARAAFATEFFEPSAARRRELVAAHRRGELARSELPRDLITLLYLNWQDDWDADVPLRETSLFLVGSTQTTAQALPHFVMNLEDWFVERPADRLLITEDPDFLRSALYESLRMFVAAPARLRRAAEDVVLKSGRQISAGDRVGLLFIPANQDPRLFGDDAEQFDPFRKTDGVPGWGLAFGSGQHACIGRPLVTGITSSHGVADGTMAIITRALYDAGLALDPASPPVRDTKTFYDAYSSLPITLIAPANLSPATDSTGQGETHV